MSCLKCVRFQGSAPPYHTYPLAAMILAVLTIFLVTSSSKQGAPRRASQQIYGISTLTRNQKIYMYDNSTVFQHLPTSMWKWCSAAEVPNFQELGSAPVLVGKLRIFTRTTFMVWQRSLTVDNIQYLDRMRMRMRMRR